ncbi:MAG: GTPase ObgE [Planctomycetia bacterium]|nr:GTPase ObgE [Planctomycetia bacterium]
MFIDYTKVTCYSGNGGAGRISFRREKFVPKGGPDGGSGGRGGNIVFVVDANLYTLQDVRYNRIYKAQHGEPGGKSEKTGKNGADLLIRVPPGTTIKDSENEKVLADLIDDGETYIACKGGIGGRGNVNFKSATNQTPRIAQPGMSGTNGTFNLELKVLADVGLVGLPNAGKSTLLSRITAATPKIADYPFTTLQPYLGIVKVGNYKSFVMADIPGIIEGASEGKGLGYQFLKHIERNRLLLFLIDSQTEEPINTFKLLREELVSYNPALQEKPYIIVRSKFDLIANDESEFNWPVELGDIVDISAVTGYGIDKLVKLIDKKLNEN